ncbi:MAG: hypothetical protein R8J84_09105 [Mariprofundales bacterium]
MICRISLICMLLLSACGYHLAGEGGSLPEATSTVVVQADNSLGTASIPTILQQLGNDKAHRFITDNNKQADNRTQLLVHQMRESLVTQGFDSSGIANQYRLELHGELLLQSRDKSEPDWRSGDLAVHGEVYASGGPAAIEANRSQVRQQLITRWVAHAIRRLRSGF